MYHEVVDLQSSGFCRFASMALEWGIITESCEEGIMMLNSNGKITEDSEDAVIMKLISIPRESPRNHLCSDDTLQNRYKCYI